MFHPRTALNVVVSAVVFTADRVRMGLFAIAAILAVKLAGAFWLPAAPPEGPVASAASVVAPIR